MARTAIMEQSKVRLFFTIAVKKFLLNRMNASVGGEAVKGNIGKGNMSVR